jgi:hypothetical protein
MGFAPGAHLIFGVLMKTHVEDEDTYEMKPTHSLFDVEEDADSRDIEDFVAERRGETDPWKALPYEIAQGDQIEFQEWVSEHPEWTTVKDRWYEITREIRDSSPVEIQAHGHYDDPEDPPTFLVLKGHEISADAWNPESLALEFLHVDSDKIAQAYEFCEANGLPSFDDPRWHLVASYG